MGRIALPEFQGKVIPQAFIDFMHKCANEIFFFLADIETLELTYRGSQLSPMTRPHTRSIPHTKHGDRSRHGGSQVKSGPDGLGGVDAQMDCILEKM